MKRILFTIILFPALAFGWPTGGNLVFQDRFDGDLSAWTEVETGGTVSIQARNDSSFFSPQMKLNDTSGSDLISATHSFAEPAVDYIIGYDEIIVSDGNVVEMQLLDASDNVIASVNHGATNDTVSFDTDGDTASTATWANNTRKQVKIFVDLDADISCWISEDDATYGSLQAVGTAKAYTGATIAKLRFTTSTGTTVAYIDEVRIYIPDMVLTGDSITDGKPSWSTHPGYPTGRLAAQEDQTSPPAYHLVDYIGSHTDTWVSNRAFGGSRTDDIDDHIQASVIDQGAKRVFIGVGHNDLMDGTALSTIEADMESLLLKLETAGITGTKIFIGNIMPSSYLNTTTEQANRDTYNAYLQGLCMENGYILVDRYNALRDSTNREILNTTYDDPDGCHLVSAGSAVMAEEIYNAMVAADIIDSDDGENCMYPANDGQVLRTNDFICSTLAQPEKAQMIMIY